MIRSALCFGLCLLLACSGRCGAARADREAPRDDDDPIPLEPAEGRDAEALGPPRCKDRVPVAVPVQLVGNAIQAPSALHVSVVLATPPSLAVLSLPEGAITPLRADPADAPPAVLAQRGTQLIAAFFGPAAKKQQSVEVVEVGGETLFRLTRAPEESLAVDLALAGESAFVLWHEDGELVLRSPTRRVLLPAPPHAVLESPRLLASGGKLLAFALARTWEGTDAAAGSGPPSTWEGAGEPRSSSQLVGFAIDDAGTAGAPIALTPPRGHVEAYDLLHGEDASVVAFARDATQTDARGGGSLVTVRWNGSGAPVRSTLRASDVGAGPLAVSAAALTYGTASGEAVLVPLGPAGSETGRASREPSLDEMRIVGRRAGQGFLLAGASELAWLACNEPGP